MTLLTSKEIAPLICEGVSLKGLAKWLLTLDPVSRKELGEWIGGIQHRTAQAQLEKTIGEIGTLWEQYRDYAYLGQDVCNWLDAARKEIGNGK